MIQENVSFDKLDGLAIHFQLHVPKKLLFLSMFPALYWIRAIHETRKLNYHGCTTAFSFESNAYM